MIVDLKGKLHLFDFEVIRVIQQVEYGEFAYVRRGNWVDHQGKYDHLKSFPFDQHKTLTDPSIKEMKNIFGQYWNDSLIKSFHGYIRYMPKKKLNYIRWQGYIWACMIPLLLASKK